MARQAQAFAAAFVIALSAWLPTASAVRAHAGEDHEAVAATGLPLYGTLGLVIGMAAVVVAWRLLGRRDRQGRDEGGSAPSARREYGREMPTSHGRDPVPGRLPFCRSGYLVSHS